MRNLTPSELESKFPKLNSQNYRRTSDATPRYNCIAFANDVDRQWWQQGLHGGMYYWPQQISDSLDGWVELFKQQRYVLTNSRGIEGGLEKVAIYVDLADMLPGHVAKSDGTTWKSKLGRYQDIEHNTLDLLEGDTLWEYGIVERVLQRPIKKTVRRSS